MGILGTSSRESFKMKLGNLWNCLHDNGWMQWRDSTRWFKNSSFIWFGMKASKSIEIKLLWLLGSSAWWILHAWKCLTLTFLPRASAVSYGTQRTNLLPDLKDVHSSITGICTTQFRAQYKYAGWEGRDCLFSVENKCSGIKFTLGLYPRLRLQKLYKIYGLNLRKHI